MKPGRKPELRWCKIEGCNRPLEALGLCSTHYRRLKRYGDPQVSQPIRRWGLIVFGIFLLGLTQAGVAAPFLVCDPYPAGADPSVTPSTFILKGLAPSQIMTGAQVNPDGTVQLHYDLANLSFGTYTVIVDAVSSEGGVSPDSSPFTFVNGIPAAPANLRIVPK